MSKDLVHYYSVRAKEYEKIYFKPERQEDIKTSCKILQELFKNKEVLEIACGTGFWTQFIAETAKSIFATDINLSVIEIARQKEIKNPYVNFEVADFYKFNSGKKFQSLFGGFIYSHILNRDLDHFFKTINKFVGEDGTIVLMDNSFVEGSNHPITETDNDGNTYQTRQLEDGTSYKVLKNFTTESFLRKKLKSHAKKIEFIQLQYFWILSYQPI